jgi:serine protease
VPTLAILITLLASCGAFQAPVLELRQERLRLDSLNPLTEITLVNSGAHGSVLRWSAASSSPLVHVSPRQGEIGGGGRDQTVRVSIDFSSLQQGAVTEATIQFESNGGIAEVPLSFLMGSEQTCGEVPSDDAIQLGSGIGPAAGAFVPGELIIGYEEPLTTLSGLGREAVLEARMASVRADHGLRSLSAVPPTGAAVERVAVSDPQAAAGELAADPRIAFAHPNYYVSALSLPNDPCYFDQWPLHGFGVPEAWELAGGAEVVVAVIDTGVDVDHEDLRGKSLPGYDLWDDDRDPRPGGPNTASAHGTHVSGIALAQGNNRVGVAGVALGANVKLLPVKIFDDSGLFATTADLVDAILWSAGLPVPGMPANPYPADVINMSVGAGPITIPAINRAVDRALKAGSVLVAAAGNNSSIDGSLGVQSPANAPGVLAVGSVDSTSVRSSFSDWGEGAPTVDLMAPGGYGPSNCRRVRSTVPWTNYGCMAGTSMAAPFASGVAALLLSREPHLGPTEVADRLRGTAFFDPEFMSSAEYGTGVLCADRALSGNRADRQRPCGSP